MPRFINKNIATLNGSVVSGSDLYPALYSAKSVEFFSTLSDKLVLMTESLKAQFERLRLEAQGRRAEGPIFASITAPKMTLGVKYEYIEYINRYGPPADGIFDAALLESVKQDLIMNGAI
jgi:hypothetical protein